VEGLSDYLAMHTSGLQNTIGLHSVNVKKEMIVPIVKEASDIRICFDFDMKDKDKNPGAEAALKLQKLIPHSKIFFVSTTKKRDIADIYREKGPSGVLGVFRGSMTRKEVKQLLDPRKHTDHRAIALFLIKKHKICSTGGSASNPDCWMFGENGIWKPVRRAIVKKIIMEVYEDDFDMDHNAKDINDVINYIEGGSTECAEGILDSLINVGNGAVDDNTIFLSNGRLDIRKKMIFDYKPEDYVTSCLALAPSPFDGDLNPNEFEKFLDQILEGKKDVEAHKKFIYQWIGYCCIPKYTQQKMLWIYGEGRNGKGRFADVISGIVGIDNIVNLSPSEFDRTPYTCGDLFGKSVNIISEIGKKDRLDSKIVKSIVGADTITSQVKYGSAMTFKTAAKFMFLTNALPDTPSSGAWLTGRLMLLELSNSFEGREDVKLGAKLSREINQIFWKSVVAYEEVIKNEKFTIPDEMGLYAAAHYEKHDYVRQFYYNEYPRFRDVPRVFERLNETAEERAYPYFMDYCKDRLGLPPGRIITRQTFVDSFSKFLK